jgi:predicted dehydrogenase
MRGAAEAPLGLGIAGAGPWGRNVVRAFARLAGVQIVAVAERRADRRAALEAAAGTGTRGFRIHSEAADLLDERGIGAVAVCTDAASHHELARQALLSGRHVYVEKPLALRVEDAEELVSVARDRGLILMVGHLMVYHPAVRWLRHRVAAGCLGEVLSLSAQRLRRAEGADDGGPWWTMAPHDVALSLEFVGSSPLSVEARQDPRAPGEVAATLRFASGARAELRVSSEKGEKVRWFTIVGSEERVAFDDTQPSEKLRVTDARTGRSFSPEIGGGEPLLLECEHFVACVRSGAEPDSAGQQGLEVVRVLAAGELSLRRGGLAVPLLPPPEGGAS